MKLHNILFTLFLICIGISSAGATTEINNSLSFPYTLSTDGETYILTENISTDGAALVIGANNITLDGGGYTISHASNVNGNGLSISSKNNITVKNLIISLANDTFSPDAYYITSTTDSTFINCTGLTTDGIAFHLYSSTPASYNNTISNCVMDSKTSYAFCISIGGSNISISNCIGSSGTSYGFYLKALSDSTVYSCIGESETTQGILLYNSINTTLKNCIGLSKYSTGVSSTSLNTTHLNVTSFQSSNDDFKLSDMLIKSTTGIVTIIINDWSNANKEWVESSDVSQPVTHIIQCEPYSYYKLYRDGDKYSAVQTSTTGLISWVYDGGFSSHTFSILPLTVENIQVSKLVDETLKAFELASVSLILLAAASIILLFKGNANINTLAVTAIISMAFLLLFGVLILSKIKSML